jgi:hypothetical protein
MGVQRGAQRAEPRRLVAEGRAPGRPRRVEVDDDHAAPGRQAGKPGEEARRVAAGGEARRVARQSGRRPVAMAQPQVPLDEPGGEVVPGPRDDARRRRGAGVRHGVEHGADRRRDAAQLALAGEPRRVDG